MNARIVLDNLLQIARAYQQATGKTTAQISKEFYGNGSFFAQVRERKYSISIDKVEAIVDKFRAAWPKGVPWPVTRSVLMGRNHQARRVT